MNDKDKQEPINSKDNTADADGHKEDDFYILISCDSPYLDGRGYFDDELDKLRRSMSKSEWEIWCKQERKRRTEIRAGK